MAKAKKDMIDAETCRKVKNMSMPEMNTYLYLIYSKGYQDGVAAAAEQFRDTFASKLEADLINGTE